ncbi:hypothetical protein IGB42_02002 [Andreprevotia sp. IGB-42]|nr:hypothetical protein IGB42_02002 [Andreprevotia sp. IGB-42]
MLHDGVLDVVQIFAAQQSACVVCNAHYASKSGYHFLCLKLKYQNFFKYSQLNLALLGARWRLLAGLVCVRVRTMPRTSACLWWMKQDECGGGRCWIGMACSGVQYKSKEP